MELKVDYSEGEVLIPINAKRTLYSIGHIGYSPAKAILDIMDNGLENGASNGYIVINRIDVNARRKQDNIKEILIIDDGDGMSLEKLINAVGLGSPDEAYRNSNTSLSKFGMGLKSAALSMGTKFDVVTIQDGKISKITIDQTKIDEEYKGFLSNPSEEDKKIIEEYNIEHGTFVRLYDLYKGVHPSYESIIDDLKDGQNAIGIIYYFLIKDKKKKIFLQGEEMPAIDVLHEDEAEGVLNENDWDGATVKYLLQKTELQIIKENGDSVEFDVTITQMPHKASRALLKDEEKAVIEDKYSLKQGNAGYYVYRNGRLISWADKLHENLRKYVFRTSNPLALDGFRGRICINTDADEDFGIDITKSNILLSQNAFDTIMETVEVIQKKSEKAYHNRTDKLREGRINNANRISNQITAEINEDGILPNQPMTTPEENREIAENRSALVAKSQEALSEEVKRNLNISSPRKTYSEEEIAKQIEEARKKYQIKGNRIILENSLPGEAAYLPYYDSEERGMCVRINRNHPFNKIIYDLALEEDNYKLMQMLLELMYFENAEAEYRVQVCMTKDSNDKEKKLVDKKFDEFRENLSFELSREAKDKGNMFDVTFENDL